jgi:Ni,Fe-hydrogenase III small subunit
VAERGTTAAPKPSPTNRTTASDVASSNATRRATPARANAALGALMFTGGVLVTPLMALGGEGTAVPMVAVVAGCAIAALLATALLTLRR